MNNKHDTNVKLFKLSKHAQITLLVNKRSTKDEACNDIEMHHVEVTGWECQGFWYWHTKPNVKIHSFILLPAPRQVHRLFQSQSSTRRDLVLLLAIANIQSSSSSHLRLLFRLPVTSILIHIFPSITRFRRQFLIKMWPVQLSFLLFVLCRKFLSSLTPWGWHSCAETCRRWYSSWIVLYDLHFVVLYRGHLLVDIVNVRKCMVCDT